MSENTFRFLQFSDIALDSKLTLGGSGASLNLSLIHI